MKKFFGNNWQWMFIILNGHACGLSKLRSDLTFLKRCRDAFISNGLLCHFYIYLNSTTDIISHLVLMMNHIVTLPHTLLNFRPTPFISGNNWSKYLENNWSDFLNFWKLTAVISLNYGNQLHFIYFLLGASEVVHYSHCSSLPWSVELLTHSQQKLDGSWAI